MIRAGDKRWVLGGGASGLAAARLLVRERASVTVLDRGTPASLDPWHDLPVDLQWRATNLPVEQPDLVLVSPGIPADSPWLLDLHARGVPCIAELELGWHYRTGRCVAVTGSSGKSTMVKWMAEAWNHAGVSAVPCGNYGIPLSDVALLASPPEVMVAEVSSFQLETVQQFTPDAGVLLNLHPNHLDRHQSLERYAAAKLRLFAGMNDQQVAAVHAPWLASARASGGHPSRWISFGQEVGGDAWLADGQVWLDGQQFLDLRETPFARPPLGVNACGIASVAAALGLPPESLRAAAESFVPLPHRMEPVGTVDGVAFINDSKATTLTALAAAVEQAEGPVHLIAGGLLKESDPVRILPVLADRCRGIYLIGQAAKPLASAWNSRATCYDCQELDPAIELAVERAQPGEVILLSPGCASFDQFEGYHHRGEVFRQRVWRLSEEKRNATT
ncbi:MAG: UDP-N-acetylmuramoyl-L-alanine--D-glutamate ligase [Kiritimatiellae bacterium]|nr:UDP-N-acetylmuramoyl-L-alanine--D-glutamate ligase [Kiritimatiellia bacterium]